MRILHLWFYKVYIVVFLFTLLVLCYALANDKTIELLSLSISLSFLSLSADLLRHPAPDALYIFRSLVFSGRSKSVLLAETYWNIFFYEPRLSLLI